MAKVTRSEDDCFWLFDCPGCGDYHGATDSWQFNGDVDKPTFSPSILYRSGHFCDKGVHDHSCWCDFNKERIEAGEEPSGFSCILCHSFVKDGFIQFLDDCSHALAGQTVELPEFAGDK